MYSYWIIAEDEKDEKLLIEIYHGSGGSSYSIPNTFADDSEEAKYKQAIKELIEYIESAVPVDYVHESVYNDAFVNITYSVKNGMAYVCDEWK